MNRKPLIPLLISFVLVIAAVAAYSFAYSLVSSKSVEVAGLAQQISQKTTATTDIAAAKSQLIALQSEESTINQYFVSTSDIVPFLEQLTATGKYLGAGVQVLSVSAKPGTPYGQLNLSLTITGPFNSVLRTLGAIEYGPYDTTVSNVTMYAPTISTVASSSPTWTANATFSIGAKTDSSPAQLTPAVSATTTSTSTYSAPPALKAL